jgi:eIF-2B alpha/beta/delta-like uncharacterized protein
MIATRVKDLDFTSADNVIEEIENMNVKGGSPFGRAAAWAYKLALQQEELSSYSEIEERFHLLGKRMHDLKPTMATIHNTTTIVQHFLEDHRSDELEILKANLIKLCDNIIEHSFLAVDKISKFGAALIPDHGIVMMHSYTSTLMGIYAQATNDGKHFSVICTESRPLRESRNAVNVLTDLGQKAVFISDASVWEFMPKADLILAGADTLCTDGSVANKMGTAQIAQLALSCKKSVYIASELFKLDPRTIEGRPVELERRNIDELVSKDDFKSPEKVEIINQFFDITPARNIAGIVTEYGVLNPAQLWGYWKLLLKELEA